MDYLKVKGLSKPVSKIIMGTAWFHLGDENEIDEMLDIYINEGGNVLDTGRFYGNGTSEGLLYKWLRRSGKRDQVYIMDKCCHPFIDRSGKHHPIRWRVSPEFITEDLIYSLNNVGVDYFDLYLMHRDDPKIPVAELMDRLEQHYREGLIKAYGVSNWQLPRIKEAMEYCDRMGYYGLSVNSAAYSLATVKVPRWPGCVYGDDQYAKWHKENDLPLFAWGSQGAGFFAGIYPTDGTAPRDIQEAYFTDENFEKLRRCQELGAEKGLEPINIALAYVLSQAVPVAAIIGSRSKDELYSSLNVFKVKLTPAEIEYLSLRSDAR
ncbi:MAG: aldo/keto reductase [Syntrophomonadaceae bacterium]|jgi:aryl-alcohol dehydrogenase-like predicted oxidoreductase